MAKDDFSYRPKYMDIRVKPPADDASKARAQKTRVCEHDECELEGAFPAPKRVGKGRHWFCKKHVAAYNKNFNFFEGMSEDEVRLFNERERHGHKKTWKFGAGPMRGERVKNVRDPDTWKGRGVFEIDDTDAGTAAVPKGRSRLQIKALVELDLDADATPAQIRARYGEYVRRFHPDSNKGDRSSEEKLARVIRAGKTLKASGLMK